MVKKESPMAKELLERSVEKTSKLAESTLSSLTKEKTSKSVMKKKELKSLWMKKITKSSTNEEPIL